MKAAMSLDEAAAETPFSSQTIRRAIQATNPVAFPPPLPAKRGSRGAYVVLRDDLLAWLRSLPDA